jgi:hypothetical protein
MIFQDLLSADHPNAIRIMAAKGAVTPGIDINPMASVEHENLIAHIPGNSPIGGEWTNRDELMSAVRRLGELAGGTLKIYPNVVATEGFAINSQRIRATRNGRTLNQLLIEVWRLEDGKGVEIWDHFENLEEWDLFWQ